MVSSLWFPICKKKHTQTLYYSFLVNLMAYDIEYDDDNEYDGDNDPNHDDGDYAKHSS